MYKEVLDLENDIKIRCFVNSSPEQKQGRIQVHPHWHDEVEILYVLRGSAFQQVNEYTFDISQGHLVVVRGQDIHATYTITPEITEILVLQFNTAILGDLEPSFSEQFSNNTLFPYPIETAQYPGLKIVDLLISIQREYTHNDIAREAFILSDCISLLGVCTRSFVCETNSIQYPLNAKKALEKIFHFIDSSYQRTISLKEAAKLSNFSVPHFCRLFRKTVGMSFIDYLNHYRVSKSLLLLKSGQTVTEIAHLCGFSSINSYIRTFKKYYSVSPSKWKE